MLQNTTPLLHLPFTKLQGLLTAEWMVVSAAMVDEEGELLGKGSWDAGGT